MFEPGTVVADRYRVVRRLGSGGMATVLLAHDERLDRAVAIKHLHLAGDSEDAAQRLRREAELGASLAHPHLVTVFDALSEGPGLLIVMEYVEGDDLAARLRHGRLSAEELVAVVRPVAEALDFAHGRGVVHRDVKPANILIARNGTVKLGDLGVASAADLTKITTSGKVLGTPAYVAPEQLEPGETKPAADVYALGVVAWEALAGRRLRTGKTALEIVQEVVAQPAPALPEGAAPPAAEAAIRRAMARDPADRPPTATAFADALAEGLGVYDTPPVTPPGGAVTPEPTAVHPTEPPPAYEPTADHPPEPTPTPAPASDPTSEHPAEPTPSPAPASEPAAEEPSPPPPAPAPTPTPTPAPKDEPPASPPPRAPSEPVAAGDRDRPGRRAALIAGGALAAVIAAVLAIVLASGGSDPSGGGSTDTRGQAQQRTTTTATTRSTAAAAPSKPGATPVSAVRGFYERAARDDFAGAWALAGPRMRAAFGNDQQRMARDLRSLESIRFVRLKERSRNGSDATLDVQTVARHTDHTDRCSGTLGAVRGGGNWRAEPRGLSCNSG
jgi:serine/threonine protein kinase